MRIRILTTSAAAVIMFAAMPVPARAAVAQWQRPAAQDRGDFGYANQQRGPAYDAGYRAGLRRGREAVRDGRALNIEREREYRDARDGYDRRYGDRDRYRDDYRIGFAQGYRDAFDRAGVGRDRRGYGYDRGVAQIAFENGARDGYTKGLDDLRHRRYPDVNRQKWYRNGDHDYKGRYGAKDVYRVDYRRGFAEGYDRAYREGRRY
jgi:hypothetical protein